MTLVMSKRQQARNERALQDLIQSVPGNDVCADCQARNPGLSAQYLREIRGADIVCRLGQLERKCGIYPPLHSLVGNVKDAEIKKSLTRY
jgi:hypothetical protein